MTATQDAPAAEIGRDRRRKEDARLITGRTRWTDNIQINGMLHLAMVRSPFAHAHVNGIDTSAAAAAPGVVGVYTADDLELGLLGPRLEVVVLVDERPDLLEAPFHLALRPHEPRSHVTSCPDARRIARSIFGYAPQRVNSRLQL